MSYFTLRMGVKMLSTAMVPRGASSRLFSAAGTYPRPLPMVTTKFNSTESSMLQITMSGFMTWKAEVNLPRSPAVKVLLTFHRDGHRLLVGVFDVATEADLLEVQNDLGHVLDHTFDG